MLRLIPAFAGNTVRSSAGSITNSVHPRVCGEHLPSAFAMASRAGSSPRVQGTRHGLLVDRVHIRFIPACAGNTAQRQTRVRLFPVHPRVCGEHASGVINTPSSRGSSPRVRGTPLRKAVGDAVRRFIPACAGNTHGRSQFHVFRSVHPRVCGEHRAAPMWRTSSAGSSPRVRGTLTTYRNILYYQRFIPACAGNTRPASGQPEQLPVHPRVCGEHPIGVATRPISDGSSPRVRGTRYKGGKRYLKLRFIPACAGNT